MPAFYGYAIENLGEGRGDMVFGVVSDGDTTEFMFPSDTEGEDIQDMRVAFGTRLRQVPDDEDIESLIASMEYNFPVNLFLSNEYATYEEAAKDLELLMILTSEDETLQEIERFTALTSEEAYDLELEEQGE